MGPKKKMGNLPNSSGNMDQGVRPVQNGEENATEIAGLCASEEPLLDVPLNPSRGTGQGIPAEHGSFQLQQSYAVILGGFPEVIAAAVIKSRQVCSHAVEKEL